MISMYVMVDKQFQELEMNGIENQIEIERVLIVPSNLLLSYSPPRFLASFTSTNQYSVHQSNLHSPYRLSKSGIQDAPSIALGWIYFYLGINMDHFHFHFHFDPSTSNLALTPPPGEDPEIEINSFLHLFTPPSFPIQGL